MNIELRIAQLGDLNLYVDHIFRFRKGNGKNGLYYSPTPSSEERDPKELEENTRKSWSMETNLPGWQRTFLVIAEGNACGHIDLHSYKLKTALHRVILGMGLEPEFRGKDIGSRLMEEAISFCRNIPQISWIDLGVFSKNTPALALYKKFGFKQMGLVEDKFRVEGNTIDDIQMSLRLR